jgi:hypothetical protein
MSLSADLREFIALLNSHGVEYIIIGAHSFAFHGRPRYAGDLDILIRPSPENAAKLSSVMNEFGFAETGFKESDFVEPHQVIQLGRVPNRLLTGITGVGLEDAFEAKIATELDALPVFMLSKELLIQNKQPWRDHRISPTSIL